MSSEQEMFGSEPPPHRPQGVLAVELLSASTQGGHDGLLLTVLVPVRRPLEEVGNTSVLQSMDFIITDNPLNTRGLILCSY